MSNGPGYASRDDAESLPAMFNHLPRSEALAARLRDVNDSTWTAGPTAGDGLAKLYERLEESIDDQYGIDFDVEKGRRKLMDRLTEQADQQKFPVLRMADGARERSRRAFAACRTTIRRHADSDVPNPAETTPVARRWPEEAQVPVNESPAPAGFWTMLDFAQQRDFRTQAAERTFAAGARLMVEGETADHVIVILEGHTEISVMDGIDAHRVIANRGPGQLVGERAALRVNMRSATVKALNHVRALAMTTPDFAAFLTRHPDILDLVERQVYERLTETAHDDKAMPEQRSLTTNPGSGTPDKAQPVEAISRLPEQHPQLNGENCTIIFSDVVAFGSPARSAEQRRIIRKEILDMTAGSLRAIWDRCSYEDRGDGLLLVAPPAVPTAQILEYLILALPIALKRHNGIYADGARIQLRVALDVGPVTTDDLGVEGQVIINAARLLEASALKKAMFAKQANLGLVVSDFVYQTAVERIDYLTDPASYAGIDIHVKESSKRAWMLLVEPPILLR